MRYSENQLNMKNLLLLVCVIATQLTFAKLNIPETPFTEYKFEAKECKVIQHNKSRIFVQPYAFYLDGKVYDGQVNLKYREFVDQLDIVLNHIPMNYNENDKQHVLESGGMFEIMAYGNEKLLSFAPNKKVQVQLASNFDVTGGETFVLNRQANTWEKATPFGKSANANQPSTDNKQDLWGDNLWQDNEGQNIVSDTNGNLFSVQSAPSGAMTYEEVRDQSFKTINADKMQLYNCDRILNEETVPIVADFKLDGYNQKLNSDIFVVYKMRNAVLTYHPTQFASDFKLLPNEDFTIFTFSKDGKIAVLDNKFTADFDVKLNKNKKVVFPMKVFAKLPQTKQELAKLTGL